MLVSWKARKESEAKLIGVKADADSLKLIADAQADARRSLAAPDDLERGVLEISSDGIKQRMEFQEKKRQANIISVVADAAAELGDRDVPDHEPDPDWTARFFDCVQDVSSEDMRKLWAKILSGEVEDLGRTSLRTLDILRNMTKNDAQLFRDICDFVIDDFVFYPEEYQTDHPVLKYDNILHIQSIGLFHSEVYYVKNLDFDHKNKYAIVLYQDSVLKVSPKLRSHTLKIPVIILTNVGKELYHIFDHRRFMDYLQSFSTFVNEKNCELSHAPIVERLPDGGFRYITSFIPIEPKPEQSGDTAP